MPIAITIPRLGWNMEQGVFVGWLKQDGETIRAGDPLFTLEGEKATQDIEASDPGILRIPATTPQAGDTVAVGALIGYLLAPGEAQPAEPSETTQNRASSARRPLRPVAVAPAASRRTSRSASELSAGPPGARELGVDWTRLAAAAAPAESARSTSSRPHGLGPIMGRPVADGASIAGRSVPIGPTRRTIAARMVESGQTTAPVTLHTTVDATNLVNLRGQFKAASPPGRELPGYTEFVVKLTAMALKDHPMLHARWDGDRLVIPEEPHIGIAVDTEEGLLVPVIRGAAGLGLGEIVVRRGTWSSAPASDGSGRMRCKAARSRSRTWAPSGSRRSPRSSTSPSAPCSAWAGSSASRSWPGTRSSRASGWV